MSIGFARISQKYYAPVATLNVALSVSIVRFVSEQGFPRVDNNF